MSSSDDERRKKPGAGLPTPEGFKPLVFDGAGAASGFRRMSDDPAEAEKGFQPIEEVEGRPVGAAACPKKRAAGAWF